MMHYILYHERPKVATAIFRREADGRLIGEWIGDKSLPIEVAHELACEFERESPWPVRALPVMMIMTGNCFYRRTDVFAWRSMLFVARVWVSHRISWPIVRTAVRFLVWARIVNELEPQYCITARYVRSLFVQRWFGGKGNA